MARVATSFKRLYLRTLFWTSSETGQTLADTLKAAAKSCIEMSGKGRVLVASNANGHDSQFQIPRDFTTQDAAELISELLDRYDEARAYLVDEGDSTPTDQEIYDEMMDKLHPVRTIRRDYTAGRIEPVEVDD